MMKLGACPLIRDVQNSEFERDLTRRAVMDGLRTTGRPKLKNRFGVRLAQQHDPLVKI